MDRPQLPWVSPRCAHPRPLCGRMWVPQGKADQQPTFLVSSAYRTRALAMEMVQTETHPAQIGTAGPDGGSESDNGREGIRYEFDDARAQLSGGGCGGWRAAIRTHRETQRRCTIDAAPRACTGCQLSPAAHAGGLRAARRRWLGDTAGMLARATTGMLRTRPCMHALIDASRDVASLKIAGTWGRYS